MMDPAPVTVFFITVHSPNGGVLPAEMHRGVNINEANY
jgi:hypothetical protein